MEKYSPEYLDSIEEELEKVKHDPELFYPKPYCTKNHSHTKRCLQ